MENKNNPVDLNEFIDCLEMSMGELRSYVNKQTGQIATFSLEEISAAEDSEWDEDECDKNYQGITAYEVIFSDQYLSLPGRWEINKYEIMRDFCDEMEDEEIQDNLLRAISGSGAFGRFHTAIHCYKLEKIWYAYLHAALKELAIKWCKANNLAYRYTPRRANGH